LWVTDDILGEQVDAFLHGFCEGRRRSADVAMLDQDAGTWRVTDLDTRIDALQAIRRGFDDLLLRDVQAGLEHGSQEGHSLWGPLYSLLNPAARLYGIRASTIARNALDLEITAWLEQDMENPNQELEQPVRRDLMMGDLVGSILPRAIDERLARFIRSCDEGVGSPFLSDVAVLMRGIDSKALEHELSSLSACRVFANWIPSQRLKHRLQGFLDVPHFIVYTRAIESLAEIFNVQETSAESIDRARQLYAVCLRDQWPSTTLYQFDNLIARFVDDMAAVWDAMVLFVELSPSLLELIGELVKEESVNLMDAVEEHGEASIRGKR